MGEGVDHQGDQVAGFLGREDGRLAFLEGVFRSTHRASGVYGQDLADDEPVEEHPDSGEMEFDGGRRHPALQFFDVSGDVDRFDLAQMGEAVPLRPGSEATRGSGVGFAGVRVPDMDGAELGDAALGVGIGRKQRRELSGADLLQRQCGGGVVGNVQVFGWERAHNMNDNVRYRPAARPFARKHIMPDHSLTCSRIPKARCPQNPHGFTAFQKSSTCSRAWTPATSTATWSSTSSASPPPRPAIDGRPSRDPRREELDRTLREFGARRVQIPVSRNAARRPFGDLPAAIRLTPGELRIAFSDTPDLAAKLVEWLCCNFGRGRLVA